MADLTERLAHLARRFSAEGFVVRDAPFFSESGIGVAAQPAATTTEGAIPVMDAMVFVYGTPKGWELRVTQPGGPHWIRRAASDRDAEDLVRGFLRDPIWPPGPEWREV